MKITIESTTKIVIIKPSPLSDGVQARIWEGTSETGIKVMCYIARVAIPDEEQEKADQFRSELIECKSPSIEAEAIPMRLILD